MTVVNAGSRTQLDAFDRALHTAEHLLPAQGPIEVFIHHNTLHMFEDLPFDEALAKAHHTFEANVYLAESEYRTLFDRGRITESDLMHAFNSLYGSEGWHAPAFSKDHIRWLGLRYGIQRYPAQRIRWELSETSLVHKLRTDLPEQTRAKLFDKVEIWLERTTDFDPLVKATAGVLNARDLAGLKTMHRQGHAEAVVTASIWAACVMRSYPIQPVPGAEIVLGAGRHYTLRDLLLVATGEDVRWMVDPTVIRCCAAYLDQGIGHWSMPNREQGLWVAFRRLQSTGVPPRKRWLRNLARAMQAAEKQNLGAKEIAMATLESFGVSEESYPSYIARVLLELPGWAGMCAQHGALLDYLAIRLVVRKEALKDLAERKLNYSGPLSGLQPLMVQKLRQLSKQAEHASDDATLGAYRLFQLAQLSGHAGHELALLDDAEVGRILHDLSHFNHMHRRRVFQAAYENHYCDRVTGSLLANLRRPLSERSVQMPSAQALFCIDDREEGIRRHLEELEPHVETFGIAGFFGFAIQYQGLDDSQSASYCPVVITPQHQVVETSIRDHIEVARARSQRLKTLKRIRRYFRSGSRSLTHGLLLTPVLGMLSILGLAARLLWPSSSRHWFRKAQHLPEPQTELQSIRTDDDDTVGFSIAEKADRVQTQLENIGLVRGFAPIVAVLGHGASTVNNPHQSAYECGACGGRNGFVCARLFAAAANHSGVRELLRQRGIDIPSTTWFVGALHNTTTDEIVYADEDKIPPTHQTHVDTLKKQLMQAAQRSAHERCRKFARAPLKLSEQAAYRHVHMRAHDLGEPRPELGHVTNALAIVGDRSLTKGLFLDRRSFLISYKPEMDPDGSILGRILAAVVPVCAGINLEYYFSKVDPVRFGAGTKLPHNLVGMLGVMEGAESDLRTGLPTQMIEIHEPLRLLMVLHTSPPLLKNVINRQPEVASMFNNGWVQVLCLDPNTQQFMRFYRGEFEPYRPPPVGVPSAASSKAWYQNQRDFLPPALISSHIAEDLSNASV